MEMKMKIATIIIIGISILCQQNNCDELLTPTTPFTPSSLETSTGKLSTADENENKDLTTQSTYVITTPTTATTTSKLANKTKTSITSTTVTHSLSVDHQSRVEVANDESLIDATTSIDEICLPQAINEGEQNYIVESIDGDIMVTTIISHRSANNATEIIKFVVKRVNEIDLITNRVTIGVRIVQILNPLKIWDILENESDFLEHCVENPFGIFLSTELWNSELLKGKNLEFKAWPLPSTDMVRTRKFAQLLSEFPIESKSNISVEIKTDSFNRSSELQAVLKTENLCFTTKPNSNSNDRILIHHGNEEFLSSIKREGNESIFMLPTEMTDKDVISTEIPRDAYIAFESEVYMGNFKTSPSEIIVISSTFVEICKSINNAIWQNCKQAVSPQVKINLAKCEIFNDLQVPEIIPTSDIRQMFKLLQLENNLDESQFTLELLKKITSQTTTNDTNNSNSVNNKRSSSELKKIATANFVTNATTFYIDDESTLLGLLFSCDYQAKDMMKKNISSHNSSHHTATTTHSPHNSNDEASFALNEKFPPELNSFDLNTENGDEIETYNWQIRSELWVAIGLTIATLGILLCIAILTFILVRICMEDVLEGNPIGSVLLLLALIAQFASFFPFTIEYSGFRRDHYDTPTAIEIFNSMCTIRIFVVSVCYCLTFSLLLSRAIMLASIGSEGGFLSHVNGYIQSIICIFSFLVQLGLSTQLLILMHANQKHVTCENVFYGKWFWAIIGYDGMLLLMLVALSPFIFRSQRNYQEGILIVITAVLCLICWLIWIPLASINHNFREIVVPLGVQATGWIILASLMVPRCFLIIRSIARSDFTQALPSLTSLAFAQANHFNSEPSLYECVNPAMRQQSTDDSLSQTQAVSSVEEYLSPSEVPTLPLRGSARRNFIEHYNNNIHFNEIVNPDLPSPNKMTRF